MGHVYVDAKVRGLHREVNLKHILADTGASFTVIGPDVLKDAGAMETPWTMDLMLGNKTKVKPATGKLEEVRGEFLLYIVNLWETRL